MDYNILINRTHQVKKTYIPEDLIIVDENENNFHRFFDPNHKVMLCMEASDCFSMFQKYAENDGYSFIINSGYRSYDYQKKIFLYNLLTKGLNYAMQYVAMPGYSEHQSGLAIDIATMKNNEICNDITPSEIEYLKNNMYKYGFILRYPEGKQDITGFQYEPWHYRYVGRELSNIIYDNDITLEEYLISKEKTNELCRKKHI